MGQDKEIKLNPLYKEEKETGYVEGKPVLVPSGRSIINGQALTFYTLLLNHFNNTHPEFYESGKAKEVFEYFLENIKPI